MASKKQGSGVSIIRKKKISSSYNQKLIELSPVSNEPMNPTSFLDIKDGLCRWPLGEPEDSDFKFCGKDRFEDKPYCLDHCAIAYVIPEKEEAEKEQVSQRS